MRRTSGKIKDFVEAQAFETIGDYALDTRRALAAYRFTEATADLLARWLDALADLPRNPAAGAAGKHAARALAGVRGAGKSHALAAFSAMLAHADVRATLADAHVAMSARRLGARRYTVLRVERGTRPTLEEEIIAAFDRAFGAGFLTNGFGGAPPFATADAMAGGTATGEVTGVKANRLAPLITVAASRAMDAPLVFVIDTAYGRGERVARDDGAILTDLAAAARNAGAFVALALDDDIAGADGANVALAHHFQIDYLDPEHLFRVAETYVLRKTPQGRAALRDIYVALREASPNFKWSEARFCALYPVHPVVADMASAVRLYAPGFALLPFAAEAAQRAAGRPAHSLITLDEVFDRAEYDLRHSAPLADALAAYDELTARAVAQLPVMARLRARLIFKAVFISSLDGRGATAADICTALLFETEGEGSDARRQTEETLMLFASLATMDGQPSRVEREMNGSEARYRFIINAAENFEHRLRAAIERATLDAATLNRLLRETAHRRFPDFPLSTDEEVTCGAASELFIGWRGTHRAGQLLCAPAQPAPDEESSGTRDAASETASRPCEWRVVLLPVELSEVTADATRLAADTGATEASIEPRELAQTVLRFIAPARFTFAWRPARPTAEDVATLKRFAALAGDEELRREFAEQGHVAFAATAAQVEHIWTRLYMDEGEFVRLDTQSDIADYALSASARPLTLEASAAPTLARLFAALLDKDFAALYTAHPRFAELLGEREVACLTTDLFGGAGAGDVAAQRAALLFAEPLGLVARRERFFLSATNDELLKHASVQAVLQLVLATNGEAVALEDINDVLGSAPFGFSIEAQQLVLVALVANRQLELMTSAGERLARRALQANVKWAEVTSVTRASGITTSVEELTAWARLLVDASVALDRIEDEFTARKSGGAISVSETRDDVRRDLAIWFASWNSERVLEECDKLPDAWLTIKNASLAQAVRRSFGVAAASVEATLSGDIELEDGLQRVADAFANSPQVFAVAAHQLHKLRRAAASFAEREQRRRYLLGIELLPDEELDDARRRLLNDTAAGQTRTGDEEPPADFDERWTDFQTRYVEYYVASHAARCDCEESQRLLDNIHRSDAWRELETLAELPLLNPHRFRRLRQAHARATEARCCLRSEDVRELLATQPVCICAFRISSGDALEEVYALEADVRAERSLYRRTLARLAAHLTDALQTYAALETNASPRAAAHNLAAAFAAGSAPENLARADVALMRAALAAVTSPPPLSVELPIAHHELLTPSELDARVRQWLDELPGEVHIVRIAGERDATHTAL